MGKQELRQRETNVATSEGVGKQLEQPEAKAGRKVFYGVASKFVLDLAKLVFGGGIVAGWFEEIPNRLHFFLVISMFFFILVALGYVLFDMDRNKSK